MGVEMNFRDLMHQHSSSFYGSPFHGRWISTGKLRILCPYCQVNQCRKNYSPGESSAALLMSKKDSYELWTFNCLACSTKKRLDLLLEDLGWIAPQNGSPEAPAEAMEAPIEILCGVGSTAIRRLARVSPDMQMGQGAWLDQMYRARKLKARSPWEKMLDN